MTLLVILREKRERVRKEGSEEKRGREERGRKKRDRKENKNLLCTNICTNRGFISKCIIK